MVVCGCVHMHMRQCMCVHTCVSACVCMHACMCAHVCVSPLPCPQQHGDTPLYWAARHGHLDMAQYLINRGATVDMQDKVWGCGCGREGVRRCGCEGAGVGVGVRVQVWA